MAKVEPMNVEILVKPNKEELERQKHEALAHFSEHQLREYLIQRRWKRLDDCTDAEIEAAIAAKRANVR